MQILLRGWEFLYFDFLFKDIALFNIELELQTLSSSKGSEPQNIQVDRAIPPFTSCIKYYSDLLCSTLSGETFMNKIDNYADCIKSAAARM